MTIFTTPMQSLPAITDCAWMMEPPIVSSSVTPQLSGVMMSLCVQVGACIAVIMCIKYNIVDGKLAIEKVIHLSLLMTES